MNDTPGAEAHELPRVISSTGFAGTRDLADPVLWSASARRSRDRRERAAGRAGLSAPTRTAALALSAAFAGSIAVSPAISEAHRVTASATAGLGSIQRALGVEADGIPGPRTRAAIMEFQRERGLVVDGIVGPQTRAALGLGASGDAASRSSAPLVRADWVAGVQRKLGVAADGVYGPVTRQAVRAFQASRGLAVDGVVGPATRAALGVSGQASETASTSVAAAPSSGSAAIAAARSQVGKPYSYGGNGPSSYDCSGLTTYAFRQAGVSLPRTSFAQYGVGRPVARASIQAGDLVFFDSNGPGASHVGIATGPTTFVSATSSGVRETSIDSSYWSSHYVGARRVA